MDLTPLQIAILRVIADGPAFTVEVAQRLRDEWQAFGLPEWPGLVEVVAAVRKLEILRVIGPDSRWTLTPAGRAALGLTETQAQAETAADSAAPPASNDAPPLQDGDMVRHRREGWTGMLGKLSCSGKSGWVLRTEGGGQWWHGPVRLTSLERVSSPPTPTHPEEG